MTVSHRTALRPRSANSGTSTVRVAYHSLSFGSLSSQSHRARHLSSDQCQLLHRLVLIAHRKLVQSIEQQQLCTAQHRTTQRTQCGEWQCAGLSETGCAVLTRHWSTAVWRTLLSGCCSMPSANSAISSFMRNSYVVCRARQRADTAERAGGIDYRLAQRHAAAVKFAVPLLSRSPSVSVYTDSSLSLSPHLVGRRHVISRRCGCW